MMFNSFTDPCTQALQTDKQLMEQLYTQPLTLNYRDSAIKLLATGFAEEFAAEVSADERLHELLMDLAEEFVEKYIPIVDDEDALSVACELLMATTITKV